MGSIAIVFSWKSLAKTNWATWATALSQVFLLSSKGHNDVGSGEGRTQRSSGKGQSLPLPPKPNKPFVRECLEPEPFIQSLGS